jgi:hypothetical protein
MYEKYPIKIGKNINPCNQKRQIPQFVVFVMTMAGYFKEYFFSNYIFLHEIYTVRLEYTFFLYEHINTRNNRAQSVRRLRITYLR